MAGKSTYELIENGLDLEVLQTSLESATLGQSKRLRLEDLEMSTQPTSGNPETTSDLYKFIYDHRINFGAKILIEKGLVFDRFRNEGGKSFHLRSEITGKNYAFIKFNSYYSEYKNHLGYTWSLALNIASTPLLTIEWHDLDGIKNLADLLINSSVRELEIEFALREPFSAKQRIKKIQEYDENKRYLITEEEQDKIRLLLNKYSNEIYAPNDNYSLIAIFNTIDLGFNYPIYTVGVLIELRHKDTSLRPDDNVKARDTLRQELTPRFASLGMGPAYFYHPMPGEVFDEPEPMILFTKHSDELLNNKENMSKFASSLTGHEKLLGDRG